MRRRLGVVLLGCISAHAAAAEPCPDAQVVAPAKGSLQLHPRPLIAWSAIPGAARYRVQIESRIPNGRVLARVDTEVAQTRFAPTQALADDRAVVKVRVTASCPGQAQASVSELPPWFLIDARGLCPAPEGLQVRSSELLAVEWRPMAGVLRTEVSVFSATDGKLLSKEEAIGARRDLPLPTEPFAVSVRNRCKEGFSESLYRVLMSDAR